MISLGQKVKFIPVWDEPEKDRNGARRRRIRVGKVIYINEPNRWFMVEYGKRKDVKLRECFNFATIGKEVKIVG